MLSATITVLALAAGSLAVAVGGPFEINWHTMDGGGGTSSGGSFELSGTIGQADAGAAMTGGSYAVSGGFWAGGEAASSCLADLNGDGTVDAADLATMLGAWGSNPGSPADLDDNGDVNAADLAILLGAWQHGLDVFQLEMLVAVVLVALAERRDGDEQIAVSGSKPGTVLILLHPHDVVQEGDSGEVVQV